MNPIEISGHLLLLLVGSLFSFGLGRAHWFPLKTNSSLISCGFYLVVVGFKTTPLSLLSSRGKCMAPQASEAQFQAFVKTIKE